MDRNIADGAEDDLVVIFVVWRGTNVANHFAVREILLEQLGLVDFVLLDLLLLFPLDFFLHFGDQVLLDGEEALDVVENVLGSNRVVEDALGVGLGGTLILESAEKLLFLPNPLNSSVDFLGKELQVGVLLQRLVEEGKKQKAEGVCKGCLHLGHLESQFAPKLFDQLIPLF